MSPPAQTCPSLVSCFKYDEGYASVQQMSGGAQPDGAGSDDCDGVVIDAHSRYLSSWGWDTAEAVFNWY